MNRFCEYNFFGLFHSSIRSGMFYQTGLQNFGKLTGKHLCQRFFLEKVAHHQVCNFIKKRLQHRFFAVNFAKLLKALFRTPPVSASNFNSTFFLTLRPGKYNNVISPCYDWTDLSLIRQVIHWKCHRKSEAVAQHCS